MLATLAPLARFYRNIIIKMFSSAHFLKLFVFKSILFFYWDENIFFITVINRQTIS